MFGIPPTGTPEAVTFWASFWPALWSGAIYSVICGIVVGIVVVSFQRGIEKRAVARAYARELSLKLHQLRNALSQREVVNISRAESTIPVPAAAALKCLEDAPVSLWREALPNKASILDLALSLQKQAAEFFSLAREVDQELHQLVRAYNHARGAISMNDEPYHQFGVGRMLGFEGNQLLPWVSDLGPNTLESYEQVWEKLSSSDRIAKLGPRFKASREAVLTTATSLRNVLSA